MSILSIFLYFSFIFALKAPTTIPKGIAKAIDPKIPKITLKNLPSPVTHIISPKPTVVTVMKE